MKKLRVFICKLFCPKLPEPSKPETLLTYKELVSMLRAYDNTRFEILVNGLGFEDTRINTFNFAELKNYMNYTEKLAKEKGIRLKGISFVKGVYIDSNTHKEDFIGYENLMYMPTAIVNGKEVLVDLIHSTKDKVVTFKEMLEKYGYEWRYDNKKNFIIGKGMKKQDKQMLKTLSRNHEELSAMGNFGGLRPPDEE